MLLLFIFGGVALMVLLGERFAKPMEPEKLRKVTRWILPLMGIAIFLSLLRYWM
jgi:uncharacterized membrane protein YfcA